MRSMSVKEINEKTRSKGMTTANVVYRFSECEGIKRTKSKTSFVFVPIEEGDLAAVYGCGVLDDKKGSSLFNIDGDVVRVHNDYAEHYANDILEEAPDQL